MIALLGQKYGAIQDTGLSATHEEIRYAIGKGKYAVVFVDKDAELDERQQRLANEAGAWRGGRRLHYVSFKDAAGFQASLHDAVAPIIDRLAETKTLDTELTEYEAKTLFDGCEFAASAQCGAFLAGDWSILGHGKALLVPVDAKVRVAVNSASDRSSVTVYERSDSLWYAHERYSQRLSAIVERALDWTHLRKCFPWVPSIIHVSCFSEVPFESGAHEETAFCLSLASCLVQAANRPQSDILPLGGAILSRWYAQVSWATLFRGSIPDKPGRHALYFSRDVGISDLRSFITDSASEEGVTRNALTGHAECTTELLHFDLNRISLWVGSKACVDISESVVNYRNPVATLDYVLAERIVDRMVARIREGRVGEEVGWLM